MTAPERKYILMGLPSTGKTSFIVALWNILESKEIEDSLTLAHLDADIAHISELRDQWLSCEEMPRTKTGFDSVVAFSLRQPNDPQIHRLIFPDANGEKFRDQWAERYWDNSYQNLVEDADGVLLFIHCGDNEKSVTINEANTVAAGFLAGENDSQQNDSQLTAQKPKEWNAKLSPTQVQLVELLQFILETRQQDASQLRIALMISAWDLEKDAMDAKGERLSPRMWLQREMPLLWQFLQANPELFNWNIYALSALGGDLGKPEIKKQLLRTHLASQRVFIFG